MSIGNDNLKVVCAGYISAPGASKKLHLFRNPSATGKATIKRITVTGITTGTATGSTYQFENWSTAGTAIKAGATGTVVASFAATAVVGATPLTNTLVSGSETLAAGEWLVLNYTLGAGDTFPEKLVQVTVEYVDGVGV